MDDKIDRPVESPVEESCVDSSTEFDDVFNRLKTAAGVKTDTELGQFLGIRQSSISGAKKRKVLPSSWVLSVASKTNVSADWLYFGYGEFRKIQPMPRPSSSPFKGSKAEESSLRSAMTHIRNCIAHGQGEIRQADTQYLVLWTESILEENDKLKSEIAELNSENRRLNSRVHDLLVENGDLRVIIAETKARGAPQEDNNNVHGDEAARRSA
jgi:hypothetical protein